MHPELMFVQDVKILYNTTLSDEHSLVNLKIQVLKNMQTYLQEEDSRMQEADRDCEFNQSFANLPQESVPSSHHVDIFIFCWTQGRKKPNRRI